MSRDSMRPVVIDGRIVQDNRPEHICERCGSTYRLVKNLRCMRCKKKLCRKCLKVIYASPTKEQSSVGTVKTIECCKEECWNEIWKFLNGEL